MRPDETSGRFWGVLLLVAGLLVLLEALGLEIASDFFWAILLIVAGVLLLLRGTGFFRR